jgi:hypothetical protein
MKKTKRERERVITLNKVGPALRAWLEKLARAENRSVSGQVIHLLEKARS